MRAARVLVQLDASAARPAIAGLARLAAAAGDRDLAGRLAARALAPPVGAPPTAVEDEQRVTNLVAGIVPATAPLDDDAEMFDRCERLSL